MYLVANGYIFTQIYNNVNRFLLDINEKAIGE